MSRDPIDKPKNTIKVVSENNEIDYLSNLVVRQTTNSIAIEIKNKKELSFPFLEKVKEFNFVLAQIIPSVCSKMVPRPNTFLKSSDGAIVYSTEYDLIYFDLDKQSDFFFWVIFEIKDSPSPHIYTKIKLMPSSNLHPQIESTIEFVDYSETVGTSTPFDQILVEFKNWENRIKQYDEFDISPPQLEDFTDFEFIEDEEDKLANEHQIIKLREILFLTSSKLEEHKTKENAEKIVTLQLEILETSEQLETLPKKEIKTKIQNIFKKARGFSGRFIEQIIFELAKEGFKYLFLS